MIQQSQSLAYIWRKVEKVKVKSLSHVRLFVTQWTVAHHAPLSMGFSRQEYRSELLFPSLGYLPDPRIEPKSPELAGGFLLSEPPEKLIYFPLRLNILTSKYPGTRFWLSLLRPHTGK